MIGLVINGIKLSIMASGTSAHFGILTVVILSLITQTKLVAITIVLLVFFYAVFRLTDFSSNPFDFSSKTG